MIAVLCATSCAAYVSEPRFGGLPLEGRQFRFAHNIELLEVSNGLRVALVRDDRTNLATVDMRYEVGSTEDPLGKTGLAHLVEHLVFMVRAEAGGPSLFEELGDIALSYNATTSADETHYTATVPIEKLEQAIAIEGRRMRASCDQIDEATFQRERDVVLAEDAERASPLNDVWLEILGAVYGKRHAYARPVGSKDVATVTRADACGFIAQYYAPNRALLVITGPFDAAKVRALVGSTFGPIKRQAKQRLVADPLVLEGSRSKHKAPITHPSVMVVFPRPSWGGDVMYTVAQARLAAVMSDADDDHPWILGTSVFQAGGPRAPAIMVEVTVASEDKVAAATLEVFARAEKLFDGLTPRQFSRIIGAFELGIVAKWDDLDTRGSWIADFMQYTDHNWFMLAEMRALTATNWDQAAKDLAGILSEENAHVAVILPSGDSGAGTLAKAVPTGTHTQVPWHAPVDASEADRPLEITLGKPRWRLDYTLPNGLRVELSPDDRSPIVDVRLVFPGGSAHEPAERYGLSTAAAGLVDVDGDRTYEPRIVEKLNFGTSRGTEIGWLVTETATIFSASGMAQWGDWHLWYLSWWLDQGGYQEVAIDRMREAAKEIASEAATTDDEVDRAELAFGTRLYGKGHPYATPSPEVGAALLKVGMKDLVGWKKARYRANGATLVVSGDFDPAIMRQAIEQLFGPWPADAPPALPSVPAPQPMKGPSWIAAVDDDVTQAQVRIGFATRSDAHVDDAARMVLQEMIQDGIRVVREGMGASYGVYASYEYGARGGALVIRGDIDEAKAGEALARILAVVAGLREGAAAERESFVRARRKALALALARSGGASSVASQLQSLAAKGLPPDYADQLAAKIAALTPQHLAEVAAADLADARMVVMVRGTQPVLDAAFAAVKVTPEKIK
ncbi:MAG TPA: pitrilysin family protein [Kofleriaceae bacterium]|nr:pitrilysin family protein [Kofleriaceae bacterium]